MHQKVIVITGLARSGKDTLADYLCEKHGFSKFVMSDALREEMGREGKDAGKMDVSIFGDELRKKEGMAAVAKIVLRKIAESEAQKIVIVGPRSPEEILLFRKNFPHLKLVKVESEAGKRYERRSSDDPQGREDFFARDKRDADNKGLIKVLETADITVENNSTPGNLHRKADRIAGE